MVVGGMVVVVVATVVVVLTFLTPQLLSSSEPDCASPPDDDCFQEQLKGSPSWDDPYLLRVVREEFLIPPKPTSNLARSNVNNDGDQNPDGNDSRTGELTDQDKMILDFVRKQFGRLNFTVAVQGMAPALMRESISGLWIEPRPETSPPPPSPHHWSSHACLAANVPYMNKAGQQCFRLTSLLLGFGRHFKVDLILAYSIPPVRVLLPLTDSHGLKVRAVLVRRSEELAELLEPALGRIEGVTNIGNTSLVLFKS